MLFLYNLLTYFSIFILQIISLFNTKINLFLRGREQSFALLKQKIKDQDQVFWFHVASLGEYEQGLPLMIALKQKHPEYKIVLSFFSPSGYEVMKDNTVADVTIYLPMDTLKNAKEFLRTVPVKQAFFVKYEFWPNYLQQLKNKNIPVYLISGIFREDQVFFKWYGGFYKKSLKCITHFFVQNQTSLKLLNSIGITNVIKAGDTRFDRVAQILEKDNTLDFLDVFTQNKQNITVIIGSSWPTDEHMLAKYINESKDENIKYVFAPHNIKPQQIENLINVLEVPFLIHSQLKDNSPNAKVYIIDTVGLLTKAYSYGDIAYIGGGFTNGIHNILEAATFGIPVIIGPKYKKFQEAKDLIAAGSCLVVHNQDELNNTLTYLLNNKEQRKSLGEIAQNYILENKEATTIILQHI